jgi:hypothetical protein
MSRVVPCGQTDMMKGRVDYRNSAKAPTKYDTDRVQMDAYADYDMRRI